MYRSVSFIKNNLYRQSSFYREINHRRESHYDILEISKLSTAKEIKAAYYKKCKELHPDKNKDDNKSHSKFVKINDAYSILSNPDSKRNYDITLNSTYSHPNPTNVYQNSNSSRAKYTYSYPHEDFSRYHINEEQMRFYREQMRYSSFYRPGSTYYQSKENSTPIPPKTLLIVSLLVCAILLFDAIFVSLTYNYDMNHLQRTYAPITDRRWKSQNTIKKEIDPKTYEAEIDDKIREYKEYESTTNVRIYKRNSVEEK